MDQFIGALSSKPALPYRQLEAEYVALARATQEVLWFRQMLTEIESTTISPTVIYYLKGNTFVNVLTLLEPYKIFKTAMMKKD